MYRFANPPQLELLQPIDPNWPAAFLIATLPFPILGAQPHLGQTVWTNISKWIAPTRRV